MLEVRTVCAWEAGVMSAAAAEAAAAEAAAAVVGTGRPAPSVSSCDPSCVCKIVATTDQGCVSASPFEIAKNFIAAFSRAGLALLNQEV